MADLIFNLIALPKTIGDLIKTGVWIHDCLRKSQDASQTLKRLEELASDIHSGQFRLLLDSMELILKEGNNEEHCRLASIHTRRLLEICEELQKKLDRCTKSEGDVRRFYFGFVAESSIQKTLRCYDRALADFQAYMCALYIGRQMVSKQASSSVRLTTDRFSVFSRYEIDDKFALDRESSIRYAKGEYKQDQAASMVPEPVAVLLERQTSQEEGNRGYDGPKTPSVIEELARIIKTRLNPHAGGVLPCLGYRIEPTLELVFRLPENLSNMPVESLQSLIENNNHGRGMILEQKLHIGHGIAASIGAVHAAKFVHKSLRPGTVLVLSASGGKAQQPHLFHPYLSCWSLMRSNYDVTSMYGTNDWTKDFYRHPDRQGLSIESRYGSGHDIYSLGVTLLELGLWEPLIVWSDRPRLSQTYYDAAKELGILEGDEWDQAKPDSPSSAKTVLLHLANTLRTRMEIVGDSYAELVKNCLTWIDHDDKVQRMAGDLVAGACYFQEEVVGPLFEMEFLRKVSSD